MNKPTHSNEIQGLRAICIALVLALHYVGPFRDTLVDTSLFREVLYRIANAGWIGVDIFFAISGFVVTRVLLRSREEGYLPFMGRRAKRLLPAYFALLAVAVAMALFPHQLGIKDGFLGAQAWAWLFVANVGASFNGGMLDGGGINLVHLWSLCVEFQFYALWPFIVWGTSGRRRLLAMASVAVAALIFRCWAAWEGVYYNAIYSLTFFRMDAFAFGGLAALAVGRQQLGRWSFPTAILLLAPVVAYLVSTVAWHKADPLVQTVGYSLLGAGAASLVLALFDGAAPRIVRAVFANKVLKWVGDRSYSLYLWHLPFQSPINGFLRSEMREISDAKLMLLSVLLNTTVATVLAELSFRFLESMRSTRSMTVA
jgi:peptidoglycan/LPS O-acetylase OafA/YrhL